MEKIIAPIFEKFENTREELFKRLDSLPAEKMNQQTKSGGWSVVQVMGHLIDAENNTTMYVSKKVEKEKNLKKAGWKAAYRYWVLKIAFAIPFAKFKVPPLLKEPSNDTSFNQAKNDWRTVRNNMREVINKLDENQLKAEIFKHPVVGKMSMIQAVKFMQTHFDRHEEQIDKILSEV